MISDSYDLVRLVSAGSLGVFAGGMLAEACILVPYWRSLEPAEFLAWYPKQGQRLQKFFGPLTYVAGIAALGGATVSLREGHPARWMAAVASLLMLGVVATFFVYFGRANASFSKAILSSDDVAAELARWARWHWSRTALSFVALAAALMTL